MSTPWLVDHAEGAVLSVRAAPGSRSERIVGVHGASLKIAVTAPPEKGRANERLVELLAGLLRHPRSSIVLVSGTTSRDKKILIRGLDRDSVAARLAQFLDS